MPKPAERNFSMPGRSRRPVWLWLVAIAVHVPLVLLLLIRRREPLAFPVFESHRIAIGDSVRAVPLPRVRRSPIAAGQTAPRRAAPAAVPTLTPTVLPPASAMGTSSPIASDTTPVRGSSDLRPHYGEGRLWLQPLAESPRTIAKALTGKTDRQLTDSAVAAMVQTYLDAMAVEQAANLKALPSWTTKIGGKTVGIDQRFVYLGPIKIPTLLLAMLMPAQKMGSISTYQYDQQMGRMRADLFDAARRAQTYDDFKKAVKDLHNQTEERRAFKKNQSAPPDTSHRG